MSNTFTPMDALDAAVKAAGSIRRLVAAIREQGTDCSENAPAMWKTRGNVPAEYCPAIEGATGVKCEALRPDVAWHILRRKQRKAGPAVDRRGRKERRSGVDTRTPEEIAVLGERRKAAQRAADVEAVHG